MQRISSLAACRELGGLAACSAGLCAWKSGPTCYKKPGVSPQWAVGRAVLSRPFTMEPHRKPCRSSRAVFAGDSRRLFGSQPGGDGGPPGSSGPRSPVSVVGIPDPLTWIRCKAIIYLIELYFELDLDSEDFEKGIKQALVHISDKMSSGRYHELVGIMSTEMIEYVEEKCGSLTAAQRKQLAIKMDDIIFVLPEDVSVVFDTYGRKFCNVVMRFWLVSTHEGPDDPEGTKIFKVVSSEDGGPEKKIATAVYEFHRELTRGASHEWTVTTVWHWHWNLAG